MTIVLGVAAGLAVFLFAVSQLSEGLHEIAGDRMHRVMSSVTRNVFLAILCGIVATAALGSSSAAIVILIALVNAEVLDFRPAMGVVMGANIGTTVKAQLFAFDMEAWLAIPLIVGFAMMAVGRSGRLRNTGRVLFGVGLLFFGLQAMGDAVSPLKEYDRWMEWVTHLESPVNGVLAGTLISAVIQSSSATVAMIIAFAAQGLMTLPAGIAIMLGAELGTCLDTLIASVGRRRAALKVGLFHLVFNLLSIAGGLLLLKPLTSLVLTLSNGADLPRTIANAHMIFNILSVVLLAGFAGSLYRFFERVLPDQAAAVAVPNPSTERS